MAVAYVADDGLSESGDTTGALNEGGSNRLVLSIVLFTDSGGAATLSTHSLDGVNFTNETLQSDLSSSPDLFGAAGYFLDGVATAGVYSFQVSTTALNSGGILIELQGVDQTTPLDGTQSEIVFAENAGPPSHTIDYDEDDMIIIGLTSSSDQTIGLPAALNGTDAYSTLLSNVSGLVGGGLDQGSVYYTIASTTETAVVTGASGSTNFQDIASFIVVVKAAAAASGRIMGSIAGPGGLAGHGGIAGRSGGMAG